MSSRNKKTRNRVKKSKRLTRSEVALATGGETVIFRSPAASSLVVPLKYVDPPYVFDNAGSTFWSRRYVMNSAYDPDPNILGGTMTYYAEYAAMYRRYRVIKFGYNIEMVNQTNNSMIAAVAPTKLDLGNNYSKVKDFAETVGGKCHLLAPNGGINRCIFKGSIDLPAFSGHAGYLVDDVTSALVNASPNQTYYFNVGVDTPGNMPASAVGARVQLTYYTVFFDRVSPFA